MSKQLIILISLLLCLNLAAHAQNYDKITYVHTDADGTPFAATDEQGDLDWQIDNYPYGKEYSNTQVARKSQISFAGKPYDEEIGLSYFGARWYDPDTGRFTGIDPAPVDPNDYRSFNRYSYGFNNPYKYVDPDGRYAEIVFEAGSLAVGFDSFIKNLRASNYQSAAVDAGGIVIDAIGVLIPGAPGVAGLGIAASRAAPVQETTTLYRAVGPDELADIQNTGELINRGSAEGKYFTDSAESASSYAKQAVKSFGDQPYTTVKTEISTSSLPSPTKVDGGIPAYVIPNKSLSTLKPQIQKSSTVPKK